MASEGANRAWLESNSVCGRRVRMVSGEDWIGGLPQVAHSYCNGYVGPTDSAFSSPLAERVVESGVVSAAGEVVAVSGSVDTALDRRLLTATLESVVCVGMESNVVVLALGEGKGKGGWAEVEAAFPGLLFVRAGEEGTPVRSQRYAALAQLVGAGIHVFHMGPGGVAVRNPLDGVVRDSDIESVSYGWEPSTRNGYGPWSDDPDMGWGRFVMNIRLFSLSPQLMYFRASFRSLLFLDRMAETLAHPLTSLGPEPLITPPIKSPAKEKDSAASDLHAEGYVATWLAHSPHHSPYMFPQPSIRIFEPHDFANSLFFFALPNSGKDRFSRSGYAMVLTHHLPDDPAASVVSRLEALNAFFCEPGKGSTHVFSAFPVESNPPVTPHKEHSARARSDGTG